MKPIDYTSFKDANDPSKQSSDGKELARESVQWWKAPEADISAAVFGQVYAIIQADKGRIQAYSEHARLYGNQLNPISGSGFTITQVNVGTTGVNRKRNAFNLIQSCTDTLTSKMSKNKVKPFFLTSKGDSKVQRKAKKLNAFTSGVFYENMAYAQMPMAFRDSCVWGEGIIEVYADHGRVKWARVLPYQLMTDYLESHEGPQVTKTLHRLKNIDRSTLIGLLPKQKAQIELMTNTNSLLSSAQQSVSDTVTIVESWRLPSAPGADDGVHCITGPGVTLFYEKYEKPFFPFAILRYSPRLHGFWGQGLAEQLDPIQTELNRCIMSVQRSLYLGGTFKFLRHVSSKVVKSHVDNTIGTIIDWAGDHPPQYITPPLVQPELYQQIKELKQMGYEQSGLSQLSANGQKPAGLNSGEAQRVYHDIETDRFQAVGQAYEAFALDLAKLSISVAKDIYKDEKSMSVKVPGKRFVETIDWKDVDLDEDEYVMQCFPESKLPTDPEGRLSAIQEMMQAGLIEPETGRRLLDYPDLDAEESLANAQLDFLHQMLDALVEDGTPAEADPHFPPMVQLKLAIEYYAVGRRDNLDDDKLELLRRYIEAVNGLMQQAQPQPPPGAAPAGGPQAAPAPPPVSNLLPNAPAA